MESIFVFTPMADHAKAVGYRNIEEYVEHLVAQNIAQQSSKSIRSQLSASEWKEKFQEMLKHAEPGNPSVDDSRESIYGGVARVAIDDCLSPPVACEF